MTRLFSLHTPLFSVVGANQSHNILRKSILICVGVLLIAVSAKISIALQPVPITMQTLAILLVAMIYGSRLGVLTILAYFAVGFAGLPVFAEALLGPTSGYLFGFLPAVFVAGWLLERGWGQHFISVFCAGLLAYSIIYLLGLSVLAVFVGWSHAWTLGFLPFILIDFIKLIVASLIVPHFWRQTEK